MDKVDRDMVNRQPEPAETPADRTSLRDEQKQLTRRRLVDAAATVFRTKGYGAAAVKDITNMADVNRATFYLHFRDKLEIFTAGAEEASEKAAIHWRALGEALRVGTREEMRGWLETAVTWWDNEADLQVAVHEALAVEPVVGALRVASLERLADELTDDCLTRYPPSRRAEIRAKAVLLVMQLDALCLRWRLKGTFAGDDDKVLDALTTIWCAALEI